MKYNEHARLQFTYTMSCQLISLVFILIGMILSYANTYLNLDDLTNFLVASAAIEIFGRLVQPYAQKYFHRGRFNYFPMNVFLVQRRLGVFILIVLGESFVGLITVDPNNGKDQRVYSFLYCALTLIFATAVSFFDAVHRSKFEKEMHAMVRSKVAGTVWQLLHIILGFSLFTMGVGLKNAYKNVAIDTQVSKSGADLVACGCGYVLKD